MQPIAPFTNHPFLSPLWIRSTLKRFKVTIILLFDGRHGTVDSIPRVQIPCTISMLYFNFYLNCGVKKTKINKKRPRLAHFKVTIFFSAFQECAGLLQPLLPSVGGPTWYYNRAPPFISIGVSRVCRYKNAATFLLNKWLCVLLLFLFNLLLIIFTTTIPTTTTPTSTLSMNTALNPTFWTPIFCCFCCCFFASIWRRWPSVQIIVTVTRLLWCLLIKVTVQNVHHHNRS